MGALQFNCCQSAPEEYEIRDLTSSTHQSQRLGQNADKNYGSGIRSGSQSPDPKKQMSGTGNSLDFSRIPAGGGPSDFTKNWFTCEGDFHNFLIPRISVPLLDSDSIVKSSIILCIPGKPNPKVPEVLKPSFNAVSRH